MLSDNDILIWVRGWEDTFTSFGRTQAECRDWLAQRVADWLKIERIIRARKG